MSAHPVWRTWMGRFRYLAGSLFGGPIAPGVTEVCRCFEPRWRVRVVDAPSPEMICTGVRLFFSYF